MLSLSSTHAKIKTAILSFDLLQSVMFDYIWFSTTCHSVGQQTELSLNAEHLTVCGRGEKHTCQYPKHSAYFNMFSYTETYI